MAAYLVPAFSNILGSLSADRQWGEWETGSLSSWDIAVDQQYSWPKAQLLSDGKYESPGDFLQVTSHIPPAHLLNT